MSIYLLWGQEDFNLEKKLAELKNKYVQPEFADLSSKNLNSPSFEELVEALCTPPFMLGSVLITINCEKYFSGGKKEIEFSDNELKQLDEILQTMNKDTHAVFVYKIPRDVNKKIDTRRKLYKTLAKYAQVEEFPQFRSYDKGLIQWIKQQAKLKEINCSEGCALILVEVCGANLRTLDSELEKLKLSIYPKKDITENAIKEICNPAEDVFKILDLYIANRRDMALNELKLINEKQHYLITLATLNTTVRNALNMKLLSEERLSAAEISQTVGIHEYRVKLQLEKLRNITTEQLIKFKKNLVNAEYQSRNGMPVELAIDIAFS